MIDKALGGDEAGYSLVEVMVSILLLTIAIIPMVGMFDAGLRAATSSGNYDKARAFANEKLEEAKSLPYESGTAVDVKNDWPVALSTPNPVHTTASLTNGIPRGLTSYKVEKRYIDRDLAAASSDANRMMKVKVTVEWPGRNSLTGNDYSATGVVSK